MPHRLTSTVRSFGSSIIRRGLAVGVLGVSLLGFAQPGQAQSNQQFANIFFAQGYGWCDARKLAKIWRTSPGRAKVLAGQKISWGNLNIVRRDWSRGVRFFQRYGFSCGQSSLPADEQQKFTYNDADSVARAWSAKRG